MKRFTSVLAVILLVGLIAGCTKPTGQDDFKKGNVIFIHPDGVGLADWHIMRALYYGPDAESNWDKLPQIGLYRGHTANSLTTSSHAGATMHSYGVKVKRDSYGMNGTEEVTALSGKKMSIMQEAMEAGIATGIINSGTIVEPGTGVFVASDESRGNREAIAEKIIKSGADLIFSGGEEWLLPEGTEGFYTESGNRKDGQNLINWAKENGYHVLYSKKDLQNIPADAEKLLGVFAESDIYNDMSEEKLKEKDLQNFNPEAPTDAEMLQVALDFFSKKDKRFFIVLEEEATDNFGNYNNANGALEALKRADDAIGVAREYLKKDPNTLILTASDSEGGGMEALGLPPDRMSKDEPLPTKDPNGAPIDGINGIGTKPFVTKPDKHGTEFAFEILWSTGYDVYGSVVSRAEGLNAKYVKNSVQNTDMYRYMYVTLFGKMLK